MSDFKGCRTDLILTEKNLFEGFLSGVGLLAWPSVVATKKIC